MSAVSGLGSTLAGGAGGAAALCHREELQRCVAWSGREGCIGGQPRVPSFFLLVISPGYKGHFIFVFCVETSQIKVCREKF